MPAKAGIQRIGEQAEWSWIPAFAGTTTDGSAEEDMGNDKLLGRSVFASQVAGGRFEVALLSLLDMSRSGLRCLLQILEVRQADPTANFVNVEVDVVRFFGFERAEQVPTKHGSIGA